MLMCFLSNFVVVKQYLAVMPSKIASLGSLNGDARVKAVSNNPTCIKSVMVSSGVKGGPIT